MSATTYRGKKRGAMARDFLGGSAIVHEKYLQCTEAEAIYGRIYTERSEAIKAGHARHKARLVLRKFSWEKGENQ